MEGCHVNYFSLEKALFFSILLQGKGTAYFPVNLVWLLKVAQHPVHFYADYTPQPRPIGTVTCGPIKPSDFKSKMLNSGIPHVINVSNSLVWVTYIESSITTNYINYCV